MVRMWMVGEVWMVDEMLAGGEEDVEGGCCEWREKRRGEDHHICVRSLLPGATDAGVAGRAFVFRCSGGRWLSCRAFVFLHSVFPFVFSHSVSRRRQASWDSWLSVLVFLKHDRMSSRPKSKLTGGMMKTCIFRCCRPGGVMDRGCGVGFKCVRSSILAVSRTMDERGTQGRIQDEPRRAEEKEDDGAGGNAPTHIARPLTPEQSPPGRPVPRATSRGDDTICGKTGKCRIR